MPDEEYDKRTDSVRQFKRNMKLGSYIYITPGRFAEKDTSSMIKPESLDPILHKPAVILKSRCIIKDARHKRGIVAFVGTTEFGSGFWIGVHLDEPLGKNNGIVDGVKYFECKDGSYGVFVRESNLIVGDYPVEEFDIDMDDF
jgi:tubulin-folding cofactor B